ncbi:MAG TPA: GNAT family N-acetyltransferase [Rhizomicrobium sp.]
MTVKLADSDADLRRCFPVIRQLRTHFDQEETFVAQARRQMANERWRLAFVEDEGEVVALAGFRLLECLATGKTLYVDDLVTREDRRSKGHGETLMRWLETRARTAGCQTFSLDSGTQRTAAHRFYFRTGMTISSFHFAKKI